MAHIQKYGTRRNVEIDTRTSMAPSDMSPDGARKFLRDIHTGIREREVTGRDIAGHTIEEDLVNFFNGVNAALGEWDNSGASVSEMKQKYGGTFVEGVKVGERLAVYEGRDFDFVQSFDESKFVFTE